MHEAGAYSVNLWVLHVCVSVTRCACVGTCFLSVNGVSEHISLHRSAFVGLGRARLGIYSCGCVQVGMCQELCLECQWVCVGIFVCLDAFVHQI